jgi:hypothetical protein
MAGAVKALDVHPDLNVNIESDDPSAAFQGQIDALRRAEDHVAHAATQPQHGLTARQQAFIDANPEMLAEPQRLSRSILDAHMANHEIDSEAFHNHVANAFRIQHLEVAAHNKASLEHQPGTAEHHQAAVNLDKFISDVNDDPPKFFKPKPMPEPEHQRGRFVSAPVSRGGTMALAGGGDYQSNNPSRVTLSAEEKSIAKALGQSEVSYAQGKNRSRPPKS